MKRMERGGAFPPRVGWLPIAIAIAAVTIVSAWSVAPQFSNHIVGTASSDNGGNGGNGGTADNTGTSSGGAGTTTGHTGGAGTTTGGGNSGSQSSTGGNAVAAGAQCAAGRNGGNTAPGVSANEIHVASTIVTTGEGAGFLREAVDGMQAAFKQANDAGGLCGRRFTISTVNDGWVRTDGQAAIDAYINSGSVFALVGEPDSEGLDAAILSKDIDRAQIPVVGTDGMLVHQYTDPWVWPVAASTVTNMHLAVNYAVHNLGAKRFGIVFDTSYKFGREGAAAFNAEVKRETGQDVAGYSNNSNGDNCVQAYCGIDTQDNKDFSNDINQLNGACKPCDVVMMLLEPTPMETWMQSEDQCNCTWYNHLMGGEPLFDDNLGSNCAGSCANMMVFTGYHPAIQPFDSEAKVNEYAQALKAVCYSCDPHNEFTEGAYLGTKLFIEACRRAGPNLTRQALATALNGAPFDLGLTVPLQYGSLPHLANTSMAVFSDNAPPHGSFNGWTYRNSGFIRDPSPGRDIQSS